MRIIIFLITFLMLSFTNVVIAQESVKSEGSDQQNAKPKNRWQKISDIQKEKKEVFNQYQQDKIDLESKYNEDLGKLQELAGPTQMKDEIKLQKKYKYDKKKLLTNFRKDNRRLERRENALKGRSKSYYAETERRRKLEKTSGEAPIIGTRKVETSQKKNYIKNKKEQYRQNPSNPYNPGYNKTRYGGGNTKRKGSN